MSTINKRNDLCMPCSEPIDLTFSDSDEDETPPPPPLPPPKRQKLVSGEDIDDFIDYAAIIQCGEEEDDDDKNRVVCNQIADYTPAATYDEVSFQYVELE